MANTYLQRTQSGTETDSKKATISAWVKLSQSVGNFNAGIFGTYVAGNYGADGNTQIGFYNGGLYAWFKDGGSTYYKQESTRRFRDNNAWYHVVYRFDMTQSTASNRIRVYLNGEEITSWAATNNPGSTQNIQMNNGGRIVRVGTYNFLNGTHNYLDGLMSHFYFCDGYSYAPTEFGETDSITGEWKIKTSTNVNHGTNGFLILKDGNTITDQSANSNDFVVDYGTLTKTEDCPSNVFATLNPLVNHNGATLSHGNTHGNKSGTHAIVYSTIPCGYPDAPSTAKFYWECKMEASTGRTVGLVKSNMPQNSTWHDDYLGQNSGGDGVIGYYLGTYVDGTQADVAYAGTAPQITISGGWSTGDIMSHAYDASTGKYWQGKNGTWFTVGGYVGDPANGNYPLVTLNATDREHFIFPADSCYDGRWSWNFGNGYFKTTQISSEGTNASGIGKFEFDVPNGFTALSTNGLNL